MMVTYKTNQNYITRTDYTGPHVIATTGNAGVNVTIVVDSQSTTAQKMTSEQQVPTIEKK